MGQYHEKNVFYRARALQIIVYYFKTSVFRSFVSFYTYQIFFRSFVNFNTYQKYFLQLKISKAIFYNDNY